MAKPPQGIGPKYLEITVDESGKTVVEAHGFDGQGCRAATASIEAGLGGVSSRKPKGPPGSQQTVRGR